jgi:GTP cyclohydrolase I
MTVQIAQELKQVLGTDDVAVVIDAKHMCVASRGIKDTSSSTVTSSFHGKFLDASTRAELLRYIG